MKKSYLSLILIIGILLVSGFNGSSTNYVVEHGAITDLAVNSTSSSYKADSVITVQDLNLTKTSSRIAYIGLFYPDDIRKVISGKLKGGGEVECEEGYIFDDSLNACVRYETKLIILYWLIAIILFSLMVILYLIYRRNQELQREVYVKKEITKNELKKHRNYKYLMFLWIPKKLKIYLYKKGWLKN